MFAKLTDIAGAFTISSPLVLHVVSLPGDYNHNGIVDGADYVVWRKDPNRTQTGYDIWRSHFGQTVSGSATGESVGQFSVPEPCAGLLMLIGSAGFMVVRAKQDY